MCLGEPRLPRRTAWELIAFWDRVMAPAERRRPPVSDDVAPIFVVGCSHSGTSIMTAVINNHPDVLSLGAESEIMCRYHSLRRHRAWLRRSLADAEKAGKSRFCEKTPNHLFFLDRLFGCYPKARIVVMQRDGRDVALSMCARWAAYRRWPPARHGDFERALRKWVAAIEVARHWEHDERVMNVVYEDFVADSDPIMAEVCEFVGVAPVAAITEDRPYWASNYQGPRPTERVDPAAHHRYRAWQVNQPIFDGSGRWRSELSPEQSAIAARVAGPLLSELGYPSD
jgi:hypothetical protein